ncbi:MAG: hypothetical protein KTR31_23190 [Myxococcales bacterium]|nr:hypothetical protein [Myxococcales bacterium]
MLFIACNTAPVSTIDSGTPWEDIDCWTPVTVRQRPTGYVQCSDGSINRESVREAVGSDVLNPTCNLTNVTGVVECREDADCGDLGIGHCFMQTDKAVRSCLCEYPCQTDEDCGDGFACMQRFTGATVSTCEPVECRTNDDCASGECGRMRMGDDSCMFAPVTLVCREHSDGCRSDSDCGPGATCGTLDGQWSCLPSTCP